MWPYWPERVRAPLKNEQITHFPSAGLISVFSWLCNKAFQRTLLRSSHCGPMGWDRRCLCSSRDAGSNPGPAQWVKDPLMLQLWCRWQLRLGFDPLPGNSTCPELAKTNKQAKKKKKRKKTTVKMIIASRRRKTFKLKHISVLLNKFCLGCTPRQLVVFLSECCITTYPGRIWLVFNSNSQRAFFKNLKNAINSWGGC